MSVKLLDINTINKIAAGEVVERPASVVKELVENAIDAQATRIRVEILNGGKSYIKVTDNGIGMNREDASLAIRSHATSKLSTASELQNVMTLGFRGEALPTIASVSKFSMWTRVKDDELGTLVRLNGGRDQLIEPQGCALGTTVLVEDLFFNTPARKKFLKTNSTEASKIGEYLTKLALSRPSIAFQLLNGKKFVLSTPGNGNLLDGIESVYGHDLVSSMLKIEFQDRADKNFRISGFISKPNVVRSYRSCQTFIVNGRVIGSRAISKAVEEAYSSLIPKNNYPLVVLSIEMSPSTVDINVHPQKSEVRFEDDSQIFRAVHWAVTSAVERRNFAVSSSQESLQQLAAAPHDFAPPPVEKEMQSAIESSNEEEPPLESPIETNDEVPPPGDEEMPPPSDEDEIPIAEPPIETPTVEQPIEETPPLFEEKFSAKKILPLGQAARCYIIAKDDDGVYIVDQHAAHERIIFDRLAGYTGGIPAQQLLVRQPLDFDERETRLIANNLELFRQLGFSIEQDSDGHYWLLEVPVDVIDGNAEEMLREIVASLPNVDSSFGDEERQKTIIAKNIREACLAMTACKAAIKAGQELNFRQMQIILDELSKTKYPFTCPHGRPTIIKFDGNELAKMFKRTGF